MKHCYTLFCLFIIWHYYSHDDVFVLAVVRYFQEYTEPTEADMTQTSTRRHTNALHPSVSQIDEEKVLLPLGENTLSQNYGIPIIVVITKVSVGVLSDFLHPHNFRYIQNESMKKWLTLWLYLKKCWLITIVGFTIYHWSKNNIVKKIK